MDTPCFRYPLARAQTQHFSTWLDMVGKIVPNMSRLGDGDAALIHSPRGKVDVLESSSPISTRLSLGPRRVRANVGSLTKWRSVSDPSMPKSTGLSLGPRRLPANLTQASLTETRSVAEPSSPKFSGIFTKWRSLSEPSSPTSTRLLGGPRRMLSDLLWTPAPPHAVLRHTSSAPDPPRDKVVKEQLRFPPAAPRAVRRYTSSLLAEAAHTPRDTVAGDDDECSTDGHDWDPERKQLSSSASVPPTSSLGPPRSETRFKDECSTDGHDWENDERCMQHRAFACPHCEEVAVPKMTPKEAVRELRTRFMARALTSRLLLAGDRA